MSGDRGLQLSVVAGPDAGRVLDLSTGRHLIGRSTGPRAIADPMVEAHHLVVEVADDRTVRLLQLTGRYPIRVDGHPVSSWVDLDAGSTIEVGSTRLVIGSGAGVASTTPRHDRIELGWRTEQLGHEPDAADGAGVAGSLTIDLAATDRIAVTGSHMEAITRSIAAQAAASDAWRVTSTIDTRGAVRVPSEPGVRQLVVCRVGDLTRLPDLARRSDVSVVVIVAPGNRVPLWCRSLLAVGETWHGEWWADRHGPVTDVVRLHLRGVRPAPAGAPEAPAAQNGGGVPGREPVREQVRPLGGQRRQVSCSSSVWTRRQGVRRSPDIGRRLRAPPPRRPDSTTRTR